MLTALLTITVWGRDISKSTCKSSSSVEEEEEEDKEDEEEEAATGTRTAAVFSLGLPRGNSWVADMSSDSASSLVVASERLVRGHQVGLPRGEQQRPPWHSNWQQV